MMNLYQIKTDLKITKNKKLEKSARFISEKMKLSANVITLLSFISGVTASLYLFENHLLFSIFIILSLFLDIFDGAVARLKKTTIEGWVIDRTADRLVTLLILTKITIYSSSFLPGLLLLLFILLTGFIFYQNIIKKRHFNIVYGDPFFHLLLILTLTQTASYYLFVQLLFNLGYIIHKFKSKSH